jgi:hypothetical protein
LIGRDTNSEAVYLPAENDLFNKQACVFFLPRLEPAEEREFEIVYRWPGLLLGLQKNGWEDFTFSFRSAGVIEEFEFELYLEDGTGGNLSDCKQIGVNLPGFSINGAENDKGWRGYRYLGRNIPPELLSEEIAARVEWKRT